MSKNRTVTDKYDVAQAVRRVLEASLDTVGESHPLIDQYQWLLEVWNTDDNRSYEDYRAGVEPEEEEEDE